MISRTLLDIEDRYRKRDNLWTDAFALMRQAARTSGYKCLACGARLWDQGAGRLYCDDTCQRRHHRRRERYRSFLREREDPCQLCGCAVD